MGLGSVRKTVLVTGAAGFLGSHLVDRLLAEGFEVIGLDNLMTGDLVNLDAAGRDPHFHLEIGDVRETLKVYAEIIFNLACPASPIHYSSDPHATLTTSVELAEADMRVAGKRVELVRKPLPNDDPRRRCPDISKARRLLGFEPKTPLDVGLKRTLDDFEVRLKARAVVS